MLPDTQRLLRDPGTESVFGLVAPVGADLDWLEQKLADLLRLYDYDAGSIRLTEAANLDRGEFDFDTPPAVGGPRLHVPLHRQRGRRGRSHHHLFPVRAYRGGEGRLPARQRGAGLAKLQGVQTGAERGCQGGQQVRR